MTRYLSCSEIADMLPRKRNGKKISDRTIWRWMEHGHKGVKLAWGRAGSARGATREAVEQFLMELAGEVPRAVNVKRAATMRTNRNRAELIAMGVLRTN